MKVLVIEDELPLLRAIERYLANEKIVVETATDYALGMEKTGLYIYDCILLDITLPGGNGLKILESLKERGLTGNVIIISAKNSIDDKIAGLDLGADDYLTKPFHLAELYARIKAVIRRKTFDGNDTLTLGNMQLDYLQRSVSIDGTELKLNRKEFDVLSFLTTNLNRLVTKETLAEHVWGDNIDMADNFDFIYAQVKNLRKKMRDANAEPVIDNVYGVGYKMTL